MNWNPANQDQILLQKCLLLMGEGSKILNGVLEVRKHVEGGKRRLVLHVCEHRPVKKKLLPAPCSTESEGEAPTWPSVGSSPEPGLWGTEGTWQKHWWKWTGGEDAANADAKLGGQSNALRWECSRKGPAVAVGTPALAVPCLEAGIEGSSPARCKGRGGGRRGERGRRSLHTSSSQAGRF